MNRLDKIVLENFNSVLLPGVFSDKSDSNFKYAKETLRYGFILSPEIFESEKSEEITKYLIDNILSGEQLNSSFHKSWDKIASSTREELLIHQLIHYFSVYGLMDLGLYSDNTIYIPNEVLNIPDSTDLKLLIKVIRAISEREVIRRILSLYTSGIALSEDTINDTIYVLNELNYKVSFSEFNDIKNKEVKVLISDTMKVYPDNPVEMVRYLVYKATGSFLLIKDKKTKQSIIDSKFDISPLVEKYGFEKLSSTYRRFKPLFLAFRGAHPNNKYVVNKLERMSKWNHTPYQVNLRRPLPLGRG